MVDLEQKIRKYDSRYEDKFSYENLQSHFMQIYLTIKLKGKDVLEIGKGIGFVSSILNQYCNLTTLDFVEEFKPDLLIDITDLNQLDTLKNNAYDLILICEVLEHIPYEKVEKVLRILEKKTRRYLIISVPNHTTYVNLVLFNQSDNVVFKTLKNYLNLFFIKMGKLISKIDYLIRAKHKKIIADKHKPEWDIHQWELGIDRYSVKLFKQLLEKYFIIIKEERLRDHSLHHFFILKRKEG